MSDEPVRIRVQVDRGALLRQFRQVGRACRAIGRAFMTGEQRYARPTELAIDGAAYRRRARRRRP